MCGISVSEKDASEHAHITRRHLCLRAVMCVISSHQHRSQSLLHQAAHTNTQKYFDRNMSCVHVCCYAHARTPHGHTTSFSCVQTLSVLNLDLVRRVWIRSTTRLSQPLSVCRVTSGPARSSSHSGSSQVDFTHTHALHGISEPEEVQARVRALWQGTSTCMLAQSLLWCL